MFGAATPLDCPSMGDPTNPCGVSGNSASRLWPPRLGRRPLPSRRRIYGIAAPPIIANRECCCLLALCVISDPVIREYEVQIRPEAIASPQIRLRPRANCEPHAAEPRCCRDHQRPVAHLLNRDVGRIHRCREGRPRLEGRHQDNHTGRDPSRGNPSQGGPHPEGHHPVELRAVHHRARSPRQ